MPMQKYIRALCHEHHVEMRHKQVLLKMQGEFKQFLTYVCPESGCAVHYNSSEGYFLTTPDGGQIEWDATRRDASDAYGMAALCTLPRFRRETFVTGDARNVTRAARTMMTC